MHGMGKGNKMIFIEKEMGGPGMPAEMEMRQMRTWNGPLKPGGCQLPHNSRRCHGQHQSAEGKSKRG